MHHQKSLVFSWLVECPISLYGSSGQRVHDELFGAGLGDTERPPVSHDHHGLRVPVGEVDVIDELDAPRAAHHMPADSHSQLKGPLLLNGEEEPNDNPEEQVEDGADDARQHSTIKAALVDKGIVVKQRPVAHCGKEAKNLSYSGYQN